MRHSEITRFLDDLRSGLRRRGLPDDRILGEVEDHLDEAVERLVAEGVPLDRAVREALHRFGDAAEIAEAFARERSPSLARIAGAALTLLAAMTSLAAALVAVSSLLPPEIHEGSTGWTAVKVIGAAFTLAIGLLTLFVWRRRSPGSQATWAAGLSLCLLGAASACAVFHLGRTTGDFELGIVAASCAMIAQGILTLLLGFGDPTSIARRIGLFET